MTDRVFAIEGEWALASDGIQWMLMRRKTRKSGPFWQPVSFVRSTKDILARCMREKGVGAATVSLLLAGLPDSFEQWKSLQVASHAV
jgi:hypothetical protein